jgi:hypothetical protein
MSRQQQQQQQQPGAGGTTTLFDLDDFVFDETEDETPSHHQQGQQPMAVSPIRTK